jgi:rare lipoprotein A
MRAVRQAVAVLLATGVVLLAVGCHHPRQQAYQPAPPPMQRSARSSSRSTHETARAPSREPRDLDDTRGKPILVETGMASWYGPNFNHRNAADGIKFDKDAMTAAHKTLPMGTTVRVTNLANGEQVVVRITDRGPFSHGRILDMSEGAAKAIGLYRMGVAKVRIEAYAHATADPAGKWCVQTGAFKTQGDAIDLKNALITRYKGARVIEFAGPTGYWVRIDPAQHERTEALAIQDWIGNPDPDAKPYLVRLD